MNTPWLTSACLNSKSGLPLRWCRLSCEPVMKLSRASTRMPCASNASHRCEPMKPAPPETTARGFWALFAANAAIRESQASHHRWIVDVAAVDHDGPAHQLLDPRHVELSKLVPFRDQNQGVGPRRHLICVLAIFHAGQQQLGALNRSGVIRAHLGPGREEDLRDVDAGRLA